MISIPFRRLLAGSSVAFTLAAPFALGHIDSEKPGAYPEFGTVERVDAGLDSRLAPAAKMELLATGFEWAEGPVWDPKGQQLLFTDVPENIAYRWTAAQGVAIHLHPSGYTGLMSEAPYEEGANGLMFDAGGHLVLCQHGDRRVARLNADGHTFSTLAGRFEGKRFNSPNDLVRDRHGNIYFTDPPYGLTDQKVGKELAIQGVYRIAPSGQVALIEGTISRPNGIGLSPDERTLYIGSSDGAEPYVLAIPLDANGHRAGEKRVFFDGTPLIKQGRRGGFDGLKVDVDGYVWATGPGGLVILNPKGKLLGSLLTGRGTANVAFGGPDGNDVFLTADDSLVRIKTRTTWVGAGW
ncbi:SMP-30/gluconolactonase/LRE family protein [Synoicihabitans lomoniglobus]|uniref:SMP-30/gluconolactonase/LRE family protein n=1 Tax=Synoicihabitans lomoniglobus TaxID=2909285 RepID=A0AAF0CNQ7_9BACT|nr:SMP-30/gluconolactonase/LRE family protein [Opitutaceae bacterium LMO-M01]WED64851.1 SMP-30/gluconolactonase/LRE family protein [Opitutaceae bacterium LMO-M01]